VPKHGEAPKTVMEIMKNRFEVGVPEPPLLARYALDQEAFQRCHDLGKRIAEKLIHTGIKS